MRKLGYLWFLPFALLIIGCVKPEIIPAPTQKVDLTAYLKGIINGTNIKWVQNVDDYNCYPTITKTTVQGTGQSSKAVYYAEMKSESVKGSLKIGLGSVLWDYNLTENPTMKLFSDFMNLNTKPKYSPNSRFGFEVQYKDKFGNVWLSDTLTKGNSVQFIGVKQESDVNYDYSKFICRFNCKVYRSYLNDKKDTILDSILMQNVEFKGWFTR
jgi:hypothetical protein